jgi:nitroreductase
VVSAADLCLFEAIYSTRALRRFKPDPVPAAVLFQLFDAAIRAPSGGNAQDWRFVIITEPALKQQIAPWFREAWALYQPRYAADSSLMDALPRSLRLSLKSTDHLVRHIAEVPVIVAVCGMRGKHSTPGGSVFPAVQNLLLAARALGLGGSITNFALAHERDLMELLGMPAEDQVYCLIPLGYPLDRQGPVRRRPVKRAVYWNRWQQPWPFAEEQPEAGWSERWLG